MSAGGGAPLGLVLLCAALLVAASPPSVTPNEQITDAARRAPPGTYARSWSGEPLYWTAIGTPDGDHEALLSEDGALEPIKGGYSIEPFVWADGERIAARDAQREQGLEAGDLPIPTVTWRHPRVLLRVRVFAATDDVAYASYRVENPTQTQRALELWLVVRPMQVLPTWQFLNLTPGFAPIREIRADDRLVRVNGAAALWPLTPPDRFGVAAGDMSDPLVRSAVPKGREARDADGFCGGVLAWRMTLAPRGAREVHVRVALHPGVSSPDAPAESGAGLVADALAAASAGWRAELAGVEIVLPSAGRDVERTLRTALSQILVNRDGPRLQSGSRNYERSWIRDGALISSALVEFGHGDEARAFLAWYAGFQLDNGAMPCCVDAKGADPTPEHDSTGAFLYALGAYARHTRDAAFVRSLWPHVRSAVRRVDGLRRERLDPRWRTQEGGAAFGILPESISHEGYAKKAVHSYWDDLFARQGLRDAVFLAELVGDAERASEWSALRDALERDLVASYSATLALRGIRYLPGSIELGDFDPTATAVAFELGGEPRDFPEAALHATFERYLAEVAERKRGRMSREAFAPYEMRIANALIRIGERDAAWDVLALSLAGRRPPVPSAHTLHSSEVRSWSQWPEIVWTDSAQGRWLGDLPHSWVDATFLHAVRTALVYERASDQTLVLAAGIPATWLASGEPLRVARLPTWWGPLDYELRRTASGALRVRIGGRVSLPPGGVVLEAPGVAPVTIRQLPTELEVPST
jgi:Amylo-alpha-1,6-glucosidase